MMLLASKLYYRETLIESPIICVFDISIAIRRIAIKKSLVKPLIILSNIYIYMVAMSKLKRSRLAKPKFRKLYTTGYKRNASMKKAFTGTLIQKLPSTGFPEKLTIRLRYNYFRTFATSGSGYDAYQFKINSVYDPDLTSTGHQPLYRDQLYLIYKYATVVSCNYSILASTTSQTGQLVGALASTYASLDSDVSATIERGQNKLKMITAGMNPVKLKGVVSMYQIFGKSKTEDITTDDLYRHDSGTDPNQLAYLSIFVQDTSLATSTISTCTTLDFTVVFNEVLKIAQS